MVFGDGSWAAFIPVALAITVVGAFVLIGRYGQILSVFTQGMEATGTISRVYFFRDRGRIEYVYGWYEEKYTSGVAVAKTKRTRVLEQGQNVTLVVDSDRPRRAFIRDLYL